MRVAAIIAAVVVGGVLAGAGVLKLGRPEAWRGQVAAMSLPRRVGVAVPIIEVVVGALLVAQWRVVGGVAASALLVGFTGFLVGQLVRGRRPVCACFGSLTAKPISWLSVARNVGLIAAAVVAVVG